LLYIVFISRSRDRAISASADVPLFLRSLGGWKSRISAAEKPSVADNFLQKQQKQRALRGVSEPTAILDRVMSAG
jgi:hypothetical protein